MGADNPVGRRIPQGNMSEMVTVSPCPLSEFKHPRVSHLPCAAVGAPSLTPLRERILSSSLKDLVLCLGFPVSEIGIFSPTCNGGCKGLNELFECF